jgi:hypothetical protein
MIKFLVVCVFVVIYSTFSSAKRFHEVDTDGDTGPFPRVGMGLAPGEDREFFLFGGGLENITGDNFFYNDMWMFEFRTQGGFSGEWTSVLTNGPTPSIRAFAAVDTVIDDQGNRFICVFGGGQFDNVGNIIFVEDSFYTFEIESSTWIDRTSLGGPNTRLGPLGVADGGKFYVHAGLDINFEGHDDFWSFDINTLTWTLITPSSSTRPVPTIAPVGDILETNMFKMLVVISGTPTTDFGFNNQTMAFNFATNVWTDITNPLHTYSPIRTFTAATASEHRKQLLMYGGDQIGGIHGCGNFAFDNPSNDVWEFDIRSQKWKELSISSVERPPKLKRHGAVQVDQHFFVMGGYDFICPNGVGPGEVLNMKVHITNSV